MTALVRLGLVVAVLAASLTASVTAAGRPAALQATKLVVYSGREERFVKPLFETYTRLTGIELEIRYGDSAELAATLLEEGSNSPADVFFAQDAGALGAVAAKGRLAVLPATTLNRVPKRFRAPGKRWIGVTGRARVIAFNTDAVKRSELPKTIWGLTQRRWKGRIGLPPTNASFQAFVTAMRLKVGDERTRAWLVAIRENEPKLYARNSQILTALARREIEVGLVNHYYLYQLKEEQPNAPVANYFLTRRDPGALLNVAGAGVVSASERRVQATRFINFLLSRGAQQFFATSPGRAEYPLVRGVQPRAGLPALAKIQGAGVNIGRLGRELEATLRMLNEVGFTR
ncbi:MAG: iron ABC transporter substrate-binding protein [Thermoleophilia bacterium]|nr:iron ABC transporter substrate-binding protein [Thermoleophilia bacterium]